MNAGTLLRMAPVTLTLAVAPVPGWAQQQLLVGGIEAGSDSITTTALDVVIVSSVSIPDTGSVWHCIATCSAEVAATVSALDIDGRLAITIDGVEVSGTDRKFELNDNPGVDDSSPIEVSTTGRKLNVGAGTHTIACAAAKVANEDAVFNVNDASLSYVCSDFRS